MRQPILTNEDLEKIRAIGDIADNQFQTRTLDITYSVDRGAEGMECSARRNLCDRKPNRLSSDGYNIIILSDRLDSRHRIAIPALLATIAVHAPSSDPQGPAHLGRPGGGNRRSARSPSFLHCWPAMVLKPSILIWPLRRWQGFRCQGAFCRKRLTADEAVERYIKAIDKGILKVMSKMGISTYQSYCGAQIFDAVGLSTEFVERYFFRHQLLLIEGVGLKEIASETVQRHRSPSVMDNVLENSLDVGGEYAYRIRGESITQWTPDVRSPICSMPCAATAGRL